MRSSLLIIAAACLLVGADSPQGNDERLQGTWYIVYANQPGEKGGRESHDFDDSKFTLTFDHGKVSATGDGKALWQGTYRVDTSRTPATIEISRRTSLFKRGVFEVKNDLLKLCLDFPANPWPDRFSVDRNSKAEVTFYKRAKPTP